MGAWLDLLSASPTPPLWLDDTDYSGRLLANGRIPWLDATALIGWRRQAVSLLKPSLAVLDVGRLAAAFSAATPEARPAAAARRPTGPLEALLSAAALRRHVAEVVQGLRQSVKLALALVMPSPRAWPDLAYQSAFGATTTVGDDETDEASVCIADFLRSFAEAGVDVLLLTDDPGTRPRDSDAVGLYQSVLNVARHYRWDVGLKTPGVPAGDAGLDFMIAPEGAIGVDLGAAFWETDGQGPAIAPGGFRYARVPEHAAPERVLARLAGLGPR
jgi:hypothetical protein